MIFFKTETEVFSKPCSSNFVHRGVRITYKKLFGFRKEVSREEFYTIPQHIGCDCQKEKVK